MGVFITIKVVQGSHHQANARYCASLVMHCSFMSLMSISWTLFKLPYFWDLIDLIRFYIAKRRWIAEIYY